MSDESKDTPPAKLKLSRDLKAKDEPEAADTNKAAPSMKLKRKDNDEASPAEAKPSSAPSEAAEPAKAETPPPPPPSGDASTAKPSYDPKKPFGDAIKQGEIKKPSSPPPELPSKPAPKIDDGSGAKVEAAINSLNEEEEEAPQKSHWLPSVIIMLILLLVLAAAGYGLWKVLQPPADSDASETAETAAPDTEAAKKGPIQKAKDAIAKVPVADVDAITGQKESPEAPAEEAPVETAELVEENFVPAPTANSHSVEANKQSVAQYLSGAHIGGVRKGDRPMILIGGESFQVGDVVHAETGLKFDGLRDERLAFRDSHGIVYLKSF